MPQVLNYSALSVKILQATPQPALMVKQAVAITMRKDLINIEPSASTALCGYLLEAEHTSVFEHVVYTFLIENVSRSFLAQLTRQRISSFTSASQHYQDYQDFPCVMSKEMEGYLESHRDILGSVYAVYKYAVNEGVPKEEARQVLPNAAAVNILWTVNARSLALFLRQRLCRRNVAEMQNFAERVLSLVILHFPELFDNVGPQCYMGTCHQGHLQCKEGSWI